MRIAPHAFLELPPKLLIPVLSGTTGKNKHYRTPKGLIYITMTLDYILSKIENSELKLFNADNNLRYIKALKSLYFWLLKLDNNFPDSAYCTASFCSTCGPSYFERVQNTILEYNYGNRPF